MSNRAETVKKSKRTLTPKLRFPEYRDEGDWEEKTGDSLFNQINDRNPAPGLPVLAITQEHGAIPRDMIDYHVSVTGKSIKSYKVVQVGDFIISLRSFQGGIEYSQFHGICSPAYVILRRRNGGSDAYFKHYLKTDRFIRVLTRNLEGLRDGKMISYKQFSELLLPVPSPPEQKKIAECLSSLDALIAAEGRMLEALKAHKKGLMQQLFPQPGQTQPRLRFPEFRDKGEWGVQSFEALYDFKPNNNYSRDQLNYDEGTVKNIHYGDIHTRFSTHFHINAEEVPFVNAEVLPNELNPDSLCRPGDVIFADASEDLADVGKCIEIIDVTDERVLSGSHTILARPRTTAIVVGFGGYLFKSRSARAGIEKEAQGTKVVQISPKRLATIKVVIPPDEQEQQRIADCLTSLDTRITAQAAKIDALKQHKRGLMQQLFPSENLEFRSEKGKEGK